MVMFCAIAEQWHTILDIVGQPTTSCSIQLRKQSILMKNYLMMRCRRHNVIDTCCLHIVDFPRRGHNQG